jgi:hypothetical protein
MLSWIRNYDSWSTSTIHCRRVRFVAVCIDFRSKIITSLSEWGSSFSYIDFPDCISEMCSLLYSFQTGSWARIPRMQLVIGFLSLWGKGAVSRLFKKVSQYFPKPPHWSSHLVRYSTRWTNHCHFTKPVSLFFKLVIHQTNLSCN